MIEITHQSVVDGLSAIVAERGENFVYPRAVERCLYVYNGEPDCGVGCFLASVGVPVERLALADEGSASGVSVLSLLSKLQEEGIVSVDREAAKILDAFQNRQDRGWTWSSALDIALSLPEAGVSGYASTPVLFERGNIVRMTKSSPWSAGSAGVVLWVDRDSAADGGEMNYKVAVIEGGAVSSKLWFSSDQLELIDDGKWEI